MSISQEERVSETNSIVSVLKKELKLHGLTYKEVGIAIGISESSVKRIFAEKDFSLKRLDQICQLMDIEISDLIRRLDMEKPCIHQLS
jgi:DNA-binding Xre family transcriptional regulator